MHDKAGNLWLFVLTTIIYVFAFYIQTKLFLNCDVSWLSHAAERLWAGGNYVHDFFETNPPLIIYLLLPPVLVKKYFALPFVLSVRSYIFLLSIISLYFCYFLLKRIFKSKHQRIANVFFITLIFIFLLLPIADFGQREHLLILFIMPYLFLVALRLQAKDVKINIYVASIIGVLAGLGFSLKPFFFLPFFLIELYAGFSLQRPELKAIFITSFLYLLSVCLFYPEYITTITPYALRLYYLGFSDPFSILIYEPRFIFCLFALALSMLTKTDYPYLMTVFKLSTLGFIGVHFSQRMYFFYHLLPAFSLAILLLVLAFSSAIGSKQSKVYYFTITLLTLLFFFYLRSSINYLWTVIVIDPTHFFTYFALIFLLAFYLSSSYQNILKSLLYIAIIITVASIFSNYLQYTDWYPHRFVISIFMLMALFALFVREEVPLKTHIVFHSVVAMVSFAFIFYYSDMRYKAASRSQISTNKFITFVQQNSKYHSIYVFSDRPAFTFFVVDYANVHYASRFPFFWMIPGLIRQDNNTQHQSDKNLLMDMIIDDLNHNKPDLIFVDVSHYKFKWRLTHYQYIADFSQKETFRAAFNHYQYLTTLDFGNNLDEAPLYQFAVYERSEE